MQQIESTSINRGLVANTGVALKAALHPVIEKGARSGLKSPEIASYFVVNKIFAHKLAAALRRTDPIQTVHMIPGPDPLRRFLASAGKRGVSKKLLSEAEAAVANFEALIRSEGGDRSGLDAIISAWLPAETRTRFETVAKQSAYRGMRQIRGLCADVLYGAAFLHPSAESDDWVDCAGLTAFLGLRCVRSNVTMRLAIRSSNVNRSPDPVALSGAPMNDTKGEFILEQFCSGPPFTIRTFEGPRGVTYGLEWGDGIGMKLSRDVVTAELRRRGVRRWREPEEAKCYVWFAKEMDTPCRRCVYDVFVHRDLYPDCQPELRTFAHGALGIADGNDPSRDIDVLDVDESLELVGHCSPSWETNDVPRHAEMYQHVLDETGWRMQNFLLYRAVVEYPMFGSHLQTRFELPVKLDVEV